MTFDMRLIAFLTGLEKLALKYGLKLVKEPEVTDAGEPEQDTEPSPYIPDSDLDYHG